MYSLVQTRSYSKSYKKFFRASTAKQKELLNRTITILLERLTVPTVHHDHALKADYYGLRLLHLQGDLLLLYKVNEALQEVELIDIGSHAYLFGK